ncbi:MAG: hypothetical protein GY950_27010 [bacterium]|nr:hypothetical protein [bacterium]
MIIDLFQLKEIAEIEFDDIVKDVIIEDINELRILLTDDSFVDVWYSLKLKDRFSYHWERRHIDGTMYRHDNAPHKKWEALKTFPRHFHNGDEEIVIESHLDEEPQTGLRSFLSFIKQKIKGMEYICTTCCKDKREDAGLLPAIQRYLSKRIEFVYEESIRLNRPLIILSGKYGYIDAEEKIPWYDQQLLPGDVDGLIPQLVRQLKEKEAEKIIFYGKPKTTPGWEPYYDALEGSCRRLGIPVEYRPIGSPMKR